jgi:small conductance mechanosensitive channel
MPELLSKLAASNLLQMILTLLLIIVLTIVALYLVKVSAETFDKRIIATTQDLDRRSRLLTLRRAAKSTIQMVILVIAVLISLSTLGIDIGPALAAAGILGLAISLGAQTLIKDVIGGIIILLEDQYRVGDHVRIGTVNGEVERITLRRTDVRDSDGRLFMIPNGDVRIAANETREWSRALVELSFSYDTDLQIPFAVLDKALARLADDPQINSYLLAAPEIFGWNALSDLAVVVKLSVKVKAGKQDDVARVLRQYAIQALREAGIPIESFSRGK